MVKIELIASPGCTKCKGARDELRTVAADVVKDGLEWREVDVLDELDYAVSLGVISLPAMAINGKLAFAGLPTAGQLRAELNKHV